MEAEDRAGWKRSKKNPDKRMPLSEHLVEFRNRAIICGVALVLTSVLGWFLYDPVLAILQSPVDEIAAQDDRIAELNYAGIASPFDMKIKVSLFIGFLLSSPVWIQQLWAFIVPGLTKTEKRYTLGFVAASIPLFLAGACLAFFAMPNAVRALTSFTPAGASNIIPAQDYLTFVMIIIVVFGIAFVLPVLMVGTQHAGDLERRPDPEVVAHRGPHRVRVRRDRDARAGRDLHVLPRHPDARAVLHRLAHLSPGRQTAEEAPHRRGSVGGSG